jgi:diguanylate cyclase (GGDEF)-like protein/PAS domain S-box-containing protein
VSLLDPSRLASVHATGVLEDVALGVADATLDRLTRLAARLLGAPTALATLVDADRQVFASAVGAPEPAASERGTPLSHSFCRHVVDSAAPLVVEDARSHPLVCDNPSVVELGVAAYAGMPLVTGGGHVLGSLCVMDATPRAWPAESLETLADLAHAVSAQLELRAAARALAETSRVRERLSATLEATPDFVATATAGGRIEYLNRGGRRLLGLADDADLGALRATDFHPPETLARLAAEALPAAARDGSWAGDAMLRRYDAEEIPVSLAMVAHSGPTAEAPPAFSAIMRDLGERAAAEHAIVAREAEHRALLAALPLVVYRVAPRPPYAPQYVSPGVAAFGYSLEEWLAEPDTWLRVLHPDDRERVVAETEGALAAGRSVDYEYRVIARDGSVRWIHDRGDFVRDASGEPLAWQGIMMDVTPQRVAEEALRESETRLRAIYESAAVGVSVIDDAGAIVQANAAFEAFLGYGPGELAGRYAPDLSPPEEREVTRAPVAGLRAGRYQSVTVEKRFVRRDGEIRWASLTLSRLPLGGGREALLGVTTDITDRRRAEEAREAAERALAESEARYRRLVELSPDAVLVHAGGVVRYANAAAVALLRAGSRDALLGRPVLDLFRPDQRAVVAERVRRVTTEGWVAPPLEEVLLRFDGTVVHCEVTGAPVQEGGEAGVQVIIRDVTARRQATAALRASEARFRAALEGGRLGFVALAPVRDAAGAVVDFDVVAANGQAGALLGMPEEDLAGQRYGGLLPLSREAGHVGVYARALATGVAQELEVHVTDPRFAAEWLRVEAVALDDQDGDGTPDGVALMVRDITPEKRAAEEVRLIADVTRALAAAPTLAAAAGAALEAMCAATRWEYGEAWIVERGEDDPSARRLAHGPVWHRADDARLAGFAAASDVVSFGWGEGMPGRAWAEREPVVVDGVDVLPETLFRAAAARAAGLRGGVAVPVLADGEVIAVLNFYTRDPRRAGQAPVALLAMVAAQVGTVMRRKLAEAALAAREERLALIYNSATDLMFLMRVERDAAGAVSAYRCESVNEAYLAVTGLAREALIGHTVQEILPPESAAYGLARYAEAERTGDAQRYDETVDLPTGRLTVETTLTPVLDDAGRCTHLLGAARDVGATRRAERALRESEARFRGVLENLRAVAVQVDTVGRVTFVNQALCALTGWTREETLGVDVFARFMPDPAASRGRYAEALARGTIAPHMEAEIVTRDGERRTVAWDNVTLRDAEGRVTGVASVGQDVTERRALESRLATLSEHDELCGLLNRRGYRRLAGHALKTAARSQRHDAVLFVDLDHFKPINDTYGHAAGDEALRAVAAIIRRTVREADVAARLGGDEFAIYAVGLNEGDGQVLADRLRANLAAHNAAARAEGRPFEIGFSVGVSELEPGDDLDVLLARADAALYAQKLARRG